MNEPVTHPKLDALLSSLQRVRRNGRGFVASCPAHEDRDPSLSIAADHRGIGLYCFAGCSVESILQKCELTWADLFFDDAPSKAKPRRRSTRDMELEAMACAARLQGDPKVLERMRFGRGWAAGAFAKFGVGWDGSRLTLPVRNAELKLHDVLRYDPFTQARKILAGKGKSRLPWPAPEYLSGRVLFLVEGEGTAISMASVGLPAVGLPGSIPKPTTSIVSPGRWEGTGWHKAWAKRFVHFRTVICLPDCDIQGRALMRAAWYDLGKVGVNVHVVDIARDVDDGRDIADELLKATYDGPTRREAREAIRMMVAQEAAVLVA